jgi:hypothetical protein
MHTCALAHPHPLPMCFTSNQFYRAEHFSRSSLRGQLVSNIFAFMVKTFTMVFKNLLLDSILTPLTAAHSPISVYLALIQSVRTVCATWPLRSKRCMYFIYFIWSLYGFHWFSKQEIKIPTFIMATRFVFLCMRITVLDIIQITVVSEMLKIKFCIVLLSTQVSKHFSLTFTCLCLITISHISPLFCHNNGIISN